MSTFILVHGAWHGAWCWEKIIPLLQQQGHMVYAPDLPGHGNDKTPLINISLQSYVTRICQLIDEIDEPVMLVGHSLAGIVITQVSEYRPQKIKKLIYLTAFLPQQGQSMLTLSQYQPASRFIKMMKQDPITNVFSFPTHAMKAFAYHLCDDVIVETIKPRLCLEPLSPIQTAVEVTQANFGTISRSYIQCTEDKAIHISTQIIMCENSPCQIFQLQSDHSPFYSMPDKLVELLLTLSKSP